MDGIERIGCIGAVILLLVAGILVALPSLQALWDQSAAERIRAEAYAEQVEHREWRLDFMTWTAYLESQKVDLLCPVGIVVVFVLVVIAYLVGKSSSFTI